jgi:hypothetical protein
MNAVWRSILAATSAALLVAVTASTAAAASPPTPSPAPATHAPGAGGTSILAPVTPSGGISALDIQVNPWGCYTRSDNPHMSYSAPGTMNAQGWTICDGDSHGHRPNEYYVESWLYYWDCFFFYCRWTQTDHRVGQYFDQAMYRAIVTHNCSSSANRAYRIETYSRVKGYVGTSYNTYDGWSAKEATIPCNV